jgi:phage terminase large subunit-like protein
VPLALADFIRFCSELKVEDGSAFELYPIQKRLLWDYFEGIRETCIIIPKKNGKTTLLAALALYHLLVTDNAECIMVAASRDQAEIILRQARMFVRSSEALQRVMRPQRREIISQIDEGRIRVIASDEDTADGVIPTLAIVDELHRHKTAELYGVLMNGLGPRDGQIITISTAASTLESPLGKMRQRAYAMPGMRRDGKYRYVRSGSLAFHELALDPEDDTENLKVVKKVNPAPWVSLSWLAERKESDTPAGWLRFACGIWTESEDPWLDPATWDALAAEFTIPERAPVVCSVKVRGSTAAIVAVQKGTETLNAEAWVFSDPEFSELEAKCREICARYRVEQVLYDPRTFKRSAELLETEGLPMFEFPHHLERISQASGSLQRVVEEHQLRHTGAPEFRAQVLAGVWKDSERGRYLTEDLVSRRPIDALIALASAVHVAGAPQVTGEALVAWA